MLLAWATDIHIDHCEADALERFYAEIRDSEAEVLLLTGDLSIAPELVVHLETLAAAVELPVFFILGNHDYYEGRISEVQSEMLQLTQRSAYLRWLPAVGVHELTPTTALVGHDCWGDGGNGDVYGSWLKMTDFRLIADLAEAFETGGIEARVERLRELGQIGADHLRQVLPDALERYEKVVLLMHPPPYRDACLYGAEVADDNWAPHFTCKAVGDLLDELMPEFPHRSLTVLAGHTHNVCDLMHRPNLRILVGAAEYGSPQISRLLRFT